MFKHSLLAILGFAAVATLPAQASIKPRTGKENGITLNGITLTGTALGGDVALYAVRLTSRQPSGEVSLRPCL